MLRTATTPFSRLPPHTQISVQVVAVEEKRTKEDNDKLTSVCSFLTELSFKKERSDANGSEVHHSKSDTSEPFRYVHRRLIPKGFPHRNDKNLKLSSSPSQTEFTFDPSWSFKLSIFLMEDNYSISMDKKKPYHLKRG